MPERGLHTGKIPLLGLGREEIRTLTEDLSLKPFQVEEICRWVYGRRTLDPAGWSNLPKGARQILKERTVPGLPEVLGEQSSSDGTAKLLLGLPDDLAVEAVCIPDGDRRTVCISSQVGCALGCAFCLTGTLGLRRNLTAGEILGQFFALEARTDIAEIPYNAVFMGMGEPLANLDSLLRALSILEDPHGMAISRRRITVSTAGLAPAMETLLDHPSCPQLALSLGAANDALRSQLMPVNRAFPLASLRKILQKATRRGRERASLEYTLLLGVNDSPAHAQEMARFARGLKVKVNLIHFNGAEGLPFARSTPERTAAFQRVLIGAGIATSVRKSRGEDILAACGQLARRGWNIEPRRTQREAKQILR